MKKLISIVLLLCVTSVLNAQTLDPFADGKGKWGYKNTEGKIVISAKYTEVSEFFGEFARVSLGVKWGLINTDGKVIIPIKYDYLGINKIKNGMIPCKLAGKLGIINTLGQIVVPTIYAECDIASETIIIVSENKLFGVYNTSEAYHGYDEKEKTMKVSQLVIPIKYTSISLARDDKMKVMKNLLLVGLTDKLGKSVYGLFNYNGLTVLDCEYELIDRFHEGKAMVSKKGVESYIGIDGNIVD